MKKLFDFLKKLIVFILLPVVFILLLVYSCLVFLVNPRVRKRLLLHRVNDAVLWNETEKVRKLLANVRFEHAADKEVLGLLLMNAARKGDTRMVKAFLDAGADVNARDEDGLTALSYVAHNLGRYHTVDVDTTKVLIEAGADVNARDEHGETALINVVTNSRHEDRAADMAKVLVEGGADANARDRRGRTALSVVADKLLDDRTVVVDMAKVLIEGGADVNARDEDEKGWTALMKAVLWSRTEIVQALLAAGADVNAESGDGWTALLLAAEGKHEEAMQALLAAGADAAHAEKELRRKGNAAALSLLAEARKRAGKPEAGRD